MSDTLMEQKKYTKMPRPAYRALCALMEANKELVKTMTGRQLASWATKEIGAGFDITFTVSHVDGVRTELSLQRTTRVVRSSSGVAQMKLDIAELARIVRRGLSDMTDRPLLETIEKRYASPT